MKLPADFLSLGRGFVKEHVVETLQFASMFGEVVSTMSFEPTTQWTQGPAHSVPRPRWPTMRSSPSPPSMLKLIGTT